MKIARSQVTKLRITEALALDPVTVIVEDIAPSQGKIIIECFGKSWSSYWGGMGGNTVSQFFTKMSADYLANCLDRGITSAVYDPDAVKVHAKKVIIERRRDRELRADEARKQFDEIEDESMGDTPDCNIAILEKIYGEEWWHALPEKPNPEYVYLCRIIEAVQAAFKQESAVPA